MNTVPSILIHGVSHSRALAAQLCMRRLNDPEAYLVTLTQEHQRFIVQEPRQFLPSVRGEW